MNASLIASALIAILLMYPRSSSARTGFSAGLGAYEDMSVSAKKGDVTKLSGNVGFSFNDDYSVSLSDRYARAYGGTVFDPDGFSDVSVSFYAHHLLHLPDRGFNVSGEVGYVIPTSLDSQNENFQTSVDGGLTASQKMGICRLSFSTEISRYFFEYDTDPSNTWFNNAYGWSNSLTLSTHFAKDWTQSIRAGVNTSFDYDNDYSVRYLISADLSWRVFAHVHLKAGVRTFQSEEAFFTSDTTSFNFGSSLTF